MFGSPSRDSTLGAARGRQGGQAGEGINKRSWRGVILTAPLALAIAAPGIAVSAPDCFTVAIQPYLVQAAGNKLVVVAEGAHACDSQSTIPVQVKVSLQRHLTGPFWPTEAQSWGADIDADDNDPDSIADAYARGACVPEVHRYRTIAEGVSDNNGQDESSPVEIECKLPPLSDPV